MTQIRYFNFGDTLTQAGMGKVLENTLPNRVYSGFDMTAASGEVVSLSAGFLLLHDGIGLEETGSNTVSLSTMLGSAAENFTVIVTHINEDILGGAGATYSAISGFYDEDTLVTAGYPNSTIIGWIKFPGLLVASGITDDMIIQRPKGPFDVYTSNQASAEPLVLTTPFNYIEELSSSTLISVTATHSASPPRNYYKISVGLGTPQTATFHISATVGALPPVSVKVRHNFSAILTNGVAVNVYDTDGNSVPVTTPSSASGTATWTESEFTLDTSSATFSEGEQFIVDVIVTGEPSQDLLLDRVKVEFSPYP